MSAAMTAAGALDGATIDRSRPVPLHRQLRDILIAALNNGDFRPGDLLPTEMELQQRFGLSRITVRRALADLVADGYLRREPGRGTFVLRAAILDDVATRAPGTLGQFLASEGRAVRSVALSLAWQPPTPKAARVLQVSPDAAVLRYDSLTYVDDRPLALALHWIKATPDACGLTLASVQAEGIYASLRRHCALVASHGERTLQAVAANAFEAQWLRVAAGAPLMLVENVVRDAGGQSVMFIKVLHPGEAYRFHTLVSFDMR